MKHLGHDLTNGWGWGPFGFNPDKNTVGTSTTTLRAGLLAAIEFVLDGPDDEQWHDLREVAAKYHVVIRDGTGFIEASKEDRALLAEVCREFADYEANQCPDDLENDQWRAWKAAEFAVPIIDDTLSREPLQYEQVS